MTTASRLFSLAFAATVSTTALAGPKFTAVNLNDTQKAKVRSALQSMNINIWNHKVVRCVIENTRKTMWKGDTRPHVYPNQSAAEQGIGMLLLGIQGYGLKEGDLNYSIRVVGQSMPRSTNGSASVGITKRADETSDGISRYEITINTATLASRSVEGIAGTIFHEMLHNIGMTHPSTGDYSVDYERHMIKEYGVCIAGKGARGLGLVADSFTYGDE